MKKYLTILLLLFTLYSNSQVVTTKIVKIPNATLSFVDNIPAFVKIINQSNYKEYLVLQPLSGIKSLSTCILGTDIIESGLGSYKYSNDSTGTTSGYVSLARFYSTILAINNTKQNNLGFTPYNSTNPAGYISSESDPTIYTWAKASVKPTYTKSEIGLDSVLNHKQWYSGFHPITPIGYGLPDYPITLPASDVYPWAKQPLKPNYTKAEVGLSNVTNNAQWYSGYHPTIFADYGLTGGTLTTPLIGTELRMVGHTGYATADFFSYNGDSTGVYGVSVISYIGANRKLFKVGFDTGDDGLNIDWINSTSKFSYKFNRGDINLNSGGISTVGYSVLTAPQGISSLDVGTLNNDSSSTYGLNAVAGDSTDNRKIFRAGIYLVNNGFTVDWRHSTNKFAYQFNQGNVNIDGSVTASNFISGTYVPSLTNTTNITSSTAVFVSYIRLGSVVHVSINGSVTPTATGSVQLGFSLPVINSNYPQGVGVATINEGNISTTFTSGLIIINSATTGYFYYHATTTSTSSFALQFDYQL
jgi:hypothetical protein